MTANQTGGWVGGERKPWLRKLEPSAAVYSWVMNNHWFTNFPLTQDGPVTFRYRILPHGTYDAASANRFGLEQAQPLAHVAANNDPRLKPLVALDNARVCASLFKSGADGQAVILRLRCLSDQSETVTLTWPAGQPKSIRHCLAGKAAGTLVADNRVVLLPYGVVTLQIENCVAQDRSSF